MNADNISNKVCQIANDEVYCVNFTCPESTTTCNVVILSKSPSF